MTSPKFAETYNVVAFLEKPEESDRFTEIIDFLKASSVSYALTVNPSSIRRDLHLDDAEGTDCLPTATIFKELACMGAKSTAWNEFSSSMASLIICLATNQKFNLSKYIFDAMVKHIDGGVKFLLYLQMGEGSNNPTDSTLIPIIDQPSSSSQPKKDKVSKKVQRQEVEVPQDETEHEECVPTPSSDP
ncbi:hypothetical protein Tco_1460801 [Tanacetum coccineum]